MLDDDQPDRTTDTGADTGPGTPEAPPAPVVTRRTRKAPAKKAAAAPEAAAPAEAAPQAAAEPAAESAEAATEAPVAKKTARRAPAKKAAPRKTAAKKTAAAPGGATTPAPEAAAPEAAAAGDEVAPATAPAKRAPRKRAAKKTAAPAAESAAAVDAPADAAAGTDTDETSDDAAPAVLFQAPVVTTTTRRTRKKPAPAAVETVEGDEPAAAETAAETAGEEPAAQRPVRKAAAKKSTSKSAGKKASGSGRGRGKAAEATEAVAAEAPEDEDATEEAAADAEGVTEEAPEVAADADESASADEGEGEGEDGEGGSARRRRRRGGRRRRKSSDSSADNGDTDQESADSSDDAAEAGASGDGDSGPDSGPDAGEGNGDGSSRRRRRRRRSGDDAESSDDEPNTVTRVRRTRSAEDQITSVAGSTRLEAKKQRRREGREAGRRRAPIVSEAEFLARRESVERVMVIRQREDLTQIGVLEDKVLVEHYVARESQTSIIGNVYLGRVQNVLPSMEAAFIDIGKGRNAVLYAGEVNWSALGHKEGAPRKIESVLSSGQMILVQVTKDPIGHKGARLTSQVSLAGRFLVYVPDGTTSGISRKLPDTERNRLKNLLKEIVPDTAGVIVRTAAEGASEEELTRDVERLKARWEDIEKKSANRGSGPQLLYGEPDLTLKVVRDLFTEDFSKLVIEGDAAWETVSAYVESVAPDLAERVQRFERGSTGGDIFATYRVNEQIQKGLDRKVWLPSGGSLVIDRTEAMTVVDVNTGKFTGSGGNLEETVTKNNLEAAEEIVRQLRLRDIGGIIVVDFIDMVLESNRDLVVRRLVECLGRDRTRHQVAEVTSLGLVQMTRKRIGTGLLESFSENCEHCHGRGVVIKDQPVDPDAKSDDGEGRRSSRRRGRRGASGENDNGSGGGNGGNGGGSDSSSDHHGHAPSPKDVAAMARHEKPVDEKPADEKPVDEKPADEAAPSVAEPADEPAASAEEPTAKPAAEAPAEAAQEVPAEAADEPAAETPVEAPAKGAAEEPAAPAPVEDEKPRVVTRTRRRSASRPAGPPAAVSVTEPVATDGSGQVPGVLSGAAGTVPDTGAVEPGTAGSEPVDAPVVEHVPIKKKGSRKR
ncbi:ribonuclease E/G [Nocardioides sp. S5]|uniref:Rne/Rng family ribonuclease n=1 Tax=Nocardioides sp. S5 TaxID=2017486 RepID=UPI001A8C68DA|nr:Rne/Rng family ribonuclease [Nocardioides sp. S5]QSR32004.1 ribonuclease E/G [Nocardioides sp. S5]